MALVVHFHDALIRILYPLHALLHTRRYSVEELVAALSWLCVRLFLLLESCLLGLLHLVSVLLLKLLQLLFQLFHQLTVLDWIVSLEPHDPVIDQLEVDAVPCFIVEVKHHAPYVSEWNPRPQMLEALNEQNRLVRNDDHFVAPLVFLVDAGQVKSIVANFLSVLTSPSHSQRSEGLGINWVIVGHPFILVKVARVPETLLMELLASNRVLDSR